MIEEPGNQGGGESPLDEGAVPPEPDARLDTEGLAESAGTSPAVGATPRAKKALASTPRNPALARAFRTKAPVEGTIVRVIKGGYEVQVGRAHGFCPHSQVDLKREDHPEQQIGKTLRFRILQLRRGGEDVVLSRRVLLEEQRAEEAKAVRATLIEGSVMQGHVAGTADFGAFVDLGAGVMGLVHLSELSHQRVNRVEDAVSVGQAVLVRVLKVHEESDRISLSIRGAQEDPWSEVAATLRPGDIRSGTVRRLAAFGAFVELAPGLEALAPASEFPPAPRGWQAEVQVGETRDWYVLSVDPRERRISVTTPGEGPCFAGGLEPGMVAEGRVQRVERYGVFVWLGPGRVGLVPRALTGAPEATDFDRRFEIGSVLPVSVVEVGEGGRRIRLARQGVRIDPSPGVGSPAARGEIRPAVKPQNRPVERVTEGASVFGTELADKLRAALKKGTRSN